MLTANSGDELILSWDIEGTYSSSITLQWFDLLMHVKLEKEFLFKSESFKVFIHFNNTTYFFGYGRSTVGAGTFGKIPRLELGEYYLTFKFQTNGVVFTNNSSEGNLPLIENHQIFKVISIPALFCFDEQEEDLESPIVNSSRL